MQSAHSVNDFDELAGLKIEQTHLISLLKNKDGSLKSKIQRLAENMKRIWQIEGIDLPINQISTEIAHLLKRYNIAIADNVNHYLSDEYKDPSQQRNVIVDRSIPYCHTNMLLDLANNERDLLAEFDNISTADMDSLYDLQKAIARKLETVATKRGHLLPGHESREDFRTPKEEPEFTEECEAIHWVREVALKKYEDYTRQFPGPSEKRRYWATGWQEFGLLYIDIANQKASQITSQWFDTILYMKHQSKHGAAVKDEIETMICDECWDDKTGQEKPDCNAEMEHDWSSPSKYRCPTCGGTKGKMRGMTREQVGDNKEPIIGKAQRLVNNLPGFYESLEKRLTEVNKRIYARKIRLGPDLAKKA